MIISLSKAGVSVRDIAAQMGISTAWVSQWRHRARLIGLLPPMVPKSVHLRASNRLKYRNSTIGSMQALFDGLTPEVADWLVDQVPPEMAVADIIRTIINDAFHDDQEEQAKADNANHSPGKIPYAGQERHR